MIRNHLPMLLMTQIQIPVLLQQIAWIFHRTTIMSIISCQDRQVQVPLPHRRRSSTANKKIHCSHSTRNWSHSWTMHRMMKSPSRTKKMCWWMKITWNTSRTNRNLLRETVSRQLEVFTWKMATTPRWIWDAVVYTYCEQKKNLWFNDEHHNLSRIRKKILTENINFDAENLPSSQS